MTTLEIKPSQPWKHKQFRLIPRSKQSAKDWIAATIITLGFILAVIPVISILATTIIKGSAGLRPHIFVDTMASASYSDPLSKGGLLHAIIGTLYLILIATIISLPLSILTALYLTEIKGRAATLIQFLIQAMSGVPSVVAGVFIYAAILLTTHLRGSTFIGALPLAILMIPTVTRTAQEVLNLVPNELREAGLALGATQWRTVMTIVVPAARSGLITATILGIARIAGETAPLLFTTGGADDTNLNPFDGNMGTIPFYIWKALIDGSPEAASRAWAGIFILMVAVLALFALARFLSRGKGVK